MQKINVQELSKAIAGYQQCKEGYKEPHQEKIEEMCKLLPHGSGINSGVMYLDESTPEKIQFSFDYHHMDEHGSYDGWTSHKVILTPSLQHKFNMRITGENRDDIKEYLYDLFHEVFE